MAVIDDFCEFHDSNPEVYTELVEMTRELRGQGHKKVGMAMLFEVIRWKRMRRWNKHEGFKLNNNLKPFYARLIMVQEPDLNDIFETRELRPNP